MLKIREILRLRELGQELRAIGLSVGASPSTVHEYLRRARNADVSAAASQAMSDSELKERLFPKGRGGDGTASQRAPFDCGHVHLELRRVGVTLQLLWAEYVEASEAQGLRPYSYSQYCDRYSLFKKTLSRSMRQEHVAGEKGFIDYSGKKPSIVDRSTGEAREVELFVMTLGASGYCFAEASLTQTSPDFCRSVVRALEDFGGVPLVLVPDQMRTAVSRPCRYDPDLHRTLADLAAHYGATVIPARPRKPKDKAKVEGAVLLVQRWVLAKIRNEVFFSLEELNGRISELVVALNARRFQKLDGSRKELYERLDRPALRALPARPFEVGEWKTAKVHPDGHVSVTGRYYSAPDRLVGERMDVWMTPSVVQLFHDGQRVASHERSYAPKGTFVTDATHLSPAARAMKSWTKERMLSRARQLGEHVERAAERVMSAFPRPELGFRAVFGILRLNDDYGASALDAACAEALEFTMTAPRRKLLVALLAKRGATRRQSGSLGHHEHVRGSDAFDFGSDVASDDHGKELH